MPVTRVLVTDGEQRSSLAAVRSLGRAGHRVFVCSCQRRPLASASRYSRGAYLVPDSRDVPEDYATAVAELVERLGVDVLLPMTDVSVQLLLRLLDSHPRLRIPCGEAGTYHAISNKAHLMRVAGEIGIPVPEQRVLEQPGDGVPDRLSGLGFPLALKPAHSVVMTQRGMRKFDVRIAYDAEDLEAQLAAFDPEAYPILAQRWVKGPGLGVFVLSWDGRTVASFAHRRIREKPPTGGVSVYRESVAARPDVLGHAERLLGHFKWTGAAMVEFKEDASTSTPYLMEVNARLWGSLQLAIDAGVDFPRLLVDLVTGAPVEAVRSYRMGIRSRWFWGDVDHLLAVLRSGPEFRRANPALGGRARAIGRFLLPWRPGDRFEVLRWSDPGPFLRETLDWVKALVSRP
jgi:predicted ATP-grasp superfamily ATP-dependent carboligase